MDDFVVCPSCGTRIKAGREFCLRCFEPLPTPGRPVRLPVWVSLGFSDTKKLIVAGVVGAIVVALVVVIWMTEPPAVDDTARPAVAVAAARPTPAPPSTSSTSVASAPADALGGVGVFEPTSTVQAGQTTLPAAEVAVLESTRTSLSARLSKEPDNPDALNDLGQVLVQLGRVQEAVPLFERAIALVPARWKFRFNLARAAADLGVWDRAVDEYREAARLRSDDFATQYALAMVLHRKGDDEAAISEFEKAIAIAPGDPNAHLSLGVSLETVGRTDDAVQEFRRYLVIQPSSADAERLKAHLQALGAGRP